MISDTNQDQGDQVNGAGDSAISTEEIKLSKAEYEELVKTKADFGSLKRDFKDLKKSMETKETKETPQTKTEEFGLVHKTYLRAAGITDSEEVELALSTAKKWGVEIDAIVDDPDFKIKLERLRTDKANTLATTAIRGGNGTNQAKNTPEFWIAKGTPPSATDVPDRKARAKIARAMMANAKGTGKKFYND